MPSWYDDEENSEAGLYVNVSEGRRVEVVVKEIIKNTEGDPQFFFKKKNGTNLGYNYHFITEDDRILTVNTFSLLKALKQAVVDVGDRIVVSHPKRGVYQVVKL